MLAEHEMSKINEIRKDCQSYINRHKKMPTNFCVNEREFNITQKARKEGIRLTVIYQGETVPVPLKKEIRL